MMDRPWHGPSGYGQGPHHKACNSTFAAVDMYREYRRGYEVGFARAKKRYEKLLTPKEKQSRDSSTYPRAAVDARTGRFCGVYKPPWVAAMRDWMAARLQSGLSYCIKCSCWLTSGSWDDMMEHQVSPHVLCLSETLSGMDHASLVKELMEEVALAESVGQVEKQESQEQLSPQPMELDSDSD